jgi:hypothetical protein
MRHRSFDSSVDIEKVHNSTLKLERRWKKQQLKSPNEQKFWKSGQSINNRHIIPEQKVLHDFIHKSKPIPESRSQPLSTKRSSFCSTPALSMPILKHRYQIVINALDPAKAPEYAHNQFQTKETERTESQVNTLDNSDNTA